MKYGAGFLLELFKESYRMLILAFQDNERLYVKEAISGYDETRLNYYMAMGWLSGFAENLIIAFLVWPLVSCAITFFCLWILGIPIGVIGFACTLVFLVCLAGNWICGSSVNLLGSAAGGVFIGSSLGIVSGLLISDLGGYTSVWQTIDQLSNSEAILGGIASSHFPPALIFCITAISIALTSYLMAFNSSKAEGHIIKGILIGLLSGLLIPLTLFTYSLFSAAFNKESFLLFAAAFIWGGLGLGVALGVRMKWKGYYKRIGLRGFIVGGISFLLFAFVMAGLEYSNDPKISLLLIGLANAIFHGTFFAVTYLIGERFGGNLAGAIASGLSGAGGYSIALLIHHNIL